MAGLKLPIESHVLQAMVSEPVKPVLDTVVTSGAVHFYISQSDKGELVMGGDLDFYNSYAQRGNLPIIEHVVAACLALFPSFGRLQLMRTWGGIMDMTMDGSPIIGKLPVEGLYMTGGWCYGGFKATPASGWLPRPHDRARSRRIALNAAFTLERFAEGRTIDEKGAGPVCLGALTADAHDAADPLPVVRRRATRSSSPMAAMRRYSGPPLDAPECGMVRAMSTCATTRAGRTTNCGCTAPAAGSGSRFAATRARTRSSAAPRPDERMPQARR